MLISLASYIALAWLTNQIFPKNASSNQLRALQDFNTAQGAGQDDYAAIESIHAFNSSGPTAIAAIIVHTNAEANSRIFDGALKGQSQLSNDLRVTNLSELTVETAARKRHHFFPFPCHSELQSDEANVPKIAKGNWVWAHLSFSNNATTLAKANAIMQEVFAELPVKGKNYTFSNVFQPISRAITRKASSAGGNVLGLSTDEDIICMCDLDCPLSDNDLALCSQHCRG